MKTNGSGRRIKHGNKEYCELEGGGSDRENDMKPWSQLSGEWKRVRTSGIVTQIDSLARDHEIGHDKHCSCMIKKLSYMSYAHT